MSGKPRLALDTSYVIAVFRGDRRPTYAMEQVALPVTVVGELRFGALGARDPKQRLDEVEELVRAAHVIPVEIGTASVYAEVRAALKAAGTPLPENDVWIAATCLQHDLILLTLDRHFDRITGLTVQSG